MENKEEEMEMETIQIDISDETLLTLAKMAHEQDITLNQLVTKLLKQELDSLEELYYKNLRASFDIPSYPLQGMSQHDLIYYIKKLEKMLYDNDIPINE